MPRAFRVNPDRTVTLPQGLQAGPGKTHIRLEAGAEIVLDDQRCIEHQHFVNKRANAEDWTEIDPSQVSDDSTPHQHIPLPGAKGGNYALEFGKPDSEPSRVDETPATSPATPAEPSQAAAAAPLPETTPASSPDDAKETP